MFGGETKTIDLGSAYSDMHGGGDEGLIDDVCDIMQGRTRSSRTDIRASMISHMIAFAAEKSRINGGAAQPVKDPEE